MENKFTNVYWKYIKHDVTITKIKLSCVSFAPHLRIFLVGGSSISLKFHGLELLRKCRCHGKAFRSLTQCIPNSSTPWRHVVDLFVFFGILASFLDWISLSVPVVIPRPESSLSVIKSVESWILGAKIEIVNCLLVHLHPQMKIQNCFPKAQLPYRH